MRIFRLIETVAVEAIHSGAECITKESFEADGLVLPLVAMTRKAEERLRRRAAKVSRSGLSCRSLRGRSRMSCFRPGRGGSPAATTSPATDLSERLGVARDDRRCRLHGPRFRSRARRHLGLGAGLSGFRRRGFENGALDAARDRRLLRLGRGEGGRSVPAPVCPGLPGRRRRRRPRPSYSPELGAGRELHVRSA